MVTEHCIQNINRYCDLFVMGKMPHSIIDFTSCESFLKKIDRVIQVNVHDTFPFNPILWFSMKEDYNELLDYCKINFINTIKEKVYEEELAKVKSRLPDAELFWYPSFTFEYSNRIWEVNNS